VLKPIKVDRTVGPVAFRAKLPPGRYVRSAALPGLGIDRIELLKAEAGNRIVLVDHDD
jgi:hypothetical protein